MFKSFLFQDPEYLRDLAHYRNCRIQDIFFHVTHRLFEIIRHHVRFRGYIVRIVRNSVDIFNDRVDLLPAFGRVARVGSGAGPSA